VPEHWRRRFKDLLRDRRRQTTTAPWLLSGDLKQDAVVLACKKMWFGPMHLGRTQEVLTNTKWRT